MEIVPLRPRLLPNRAPRSDTKDETLIQEQID